MLFPQKEAKPTIEEDPSYSLDTYYGNTADQCRNNRVNLIWLHTTWDQMAAFLSLENITLLPR